jgi:hypothetical protein
MATTAMTTDDHTRRIVPCREQGCRAQLIYLPTRNGSRMPCDAETVLPDDVVYDPQKHMSHFKTCTNPNRFSKGKRQ